MGNKEKASIWIPSYLKRNSTVQLHLYLLWWPYEEDYRNIYKVVSQCMVSVLQVCVSQIQEGTVSEHLCFKNLMSLTAYHVMSFTIRELVSYNGTKLDWIFTIICWFNNILSSTETLRTTLYYTKYCCKFFADSYWF